jgi:triphosphoribosyl-dephospho-CoA synthase
MTLAADRDSIARQYADGFRDIFEMLANAPAGDPRALTLDVFLSFLGGWPDSHIVRKQGVTVAQSVTADARRHRAHWRTHHALPPLAAWDAELKARGINPGTSADLTVATLFVAGCLDPARTGVAAARNVDWHGS